MIKPIAQGKRQRLQNEEPGGKLNFSSEWASVFKAEAFYFTWRSLKALAMTDTELKLMAVAAMMGLSKIPKKG